MTRNFILWCPVVVEVVCARHLIAREDDGSALKGAGRYAAIAYDTLGTPRAPQPPGREVKVPGFGVTMDTGAPEGADWYDACLYVQFRRGGKGDWQYAPVVRGAV